MVANISPIDQYWVGSIRRESLVGMTQVVLSIWLFRELIT